MLLLCSKCLLILRSKKMSVFSPFLNNVIFYFISHANLLGGLLKYTCMGSVRDAAYLCRNSRWSTWKVSLFSFFFFVLLSLNCIFMQCIVILMSCCILLNLMVCVHLIQALILSCYRILKPFCKHCLLYLKPFSNWLLPLHKHFSGHLHVSRMKLR